MQPLQARPRAHQLVQQARRGLRRRAVDVVLLAQVHQHEARRLRGQVLRQLAGQRLLQAAHHADAAPRRREVNLDWRLVVPVCGRGLQGVNAQDTGHRTTRVRLERCTAT